MPSALENLHSLHQYEEKIRSESLAAIAADSALSDHLQATHDALNYLTVLLEVKTQPGDDLHTLQLLVIRQFNVGASAAKLGLSGYYQHAFQVLRDSLELVNLVDLFRAEPAKVTEWRTADERQLAKTFSPRAVRDALAKLPEFSGQDRKRLYALFSGIASHATYKGFQLIAPGNSPRFGPFFDKKLLKALLEDLGKLLSHAALSLGRPFEHAELPIQLAKADYIESLRRYYEKHIRAANPA
jgi:hypothetical protein